MLAELDVLRCRWFDEGKKSDHIDAQLLLRLMRQGKVEGDELG